MELGSGCVALLILPCCATHRAKWNGQPWRNYPAGQYEKEGQAECHTGPLTTVSSHFASSQQQANSCVKFWDPQTLVRVVILVIRIGFQCEKFHSHFGAWNCRKFCNAHIMVLCCDEIPMNSDNNRTPWCVRIFLDQDYGIVLLWGSGLWHSFTLRQWNSSKAVSLK